MFGIGKTGSGDNLRSRFPLSLPPNLSEALSVAERAEAVVLCLGLSADIEGEQGDAGNSEAAGDKTSLALTGLQQQLLETITALGKPTVLVLIAGSALDVRWAHDHVGAIVDAWYPGEEGGTAIAEVLFGDVSPGGRLPVTFPRSTEDVPEFTSYDMTGRTYRFIDKEPLYPFGYGLSYSDFAYSQLELSASRSDLSVPIQLSVTVTNSGKRAADEVVQIYVKDVEASTRVPHHSLRGFERVHLEARESRRMGFELTARDLSLIDDQGRRILEPGRFRLFVGGNQPDARSVALTGNAPLFADFELTGAARQLPY